MFLRVQREKMKKSLLILVLFVSNGLCASSNQPSLDKIKVTILSELECLPARSEISLQQNGYPERISNISWYNDADRAQKIEQAKNDYLQNLKLRAAVTLKK